MTTDATLQQFEDNMLKQVSPLEKTSRELLVKANAQDIKDNGSLARAIAVKKEIKAHSTLIKDSRMALTRPLDDMKKLIMAKESEVTAPLDEAQGVVKGKIQDYEDELERVRQEEQKRVSAILEELNVSVYMLETPAGVDKQGAYIKKVFTELSDTDQANADIKLAFRQSVDALTTRKANLEEEIRQAAERERLAKVAQEQSAAQAKLEREKAAIEAEQRRIEAEKERQQRELERQQFEAEAEAQRKAQEKLDKEKPKSNIATVTSFEIENEYLIDRKYCSPDSVKIRQAVKDGVTEIAGVRIFQTKQVR